MSWRLKRIQYQKLILLLDGVKNATHRALLKRELPEFVSLRSVRSLYKDLSKTRIEKDLKDVQEIIDLLKEVFIHPLKKEVLFLCQVVSLQLQTLKMT